jgi:hypothetical protein
LSRASLTEDAQPFLLRPAASIARRCEISNGEFRPKHLPSGVAKSGDLSARLDLSGLVRAGLRTRSAAGLISRRRWASHRTVARRRRLGNKESSASEHLGDSKEEQRYDNQNRAKNAGRNEDCGGKSLLRLWLSYAHSHDETVNDSLYELHRVTSPEQIPHAAQSACVLLILLLALGGSMRELRWSLRSSTEEVTLRPLLGRSRSTLSLLEFASPFPLWDRALWQPRHTRERYHFPTVRKPANRSTFPRGLANHAAEVDS